MRISDWSSDVCSSDLLVFRFPAVAVEEPDHRQDDGEGIPGDGILQVVVWQVHAGLAADRKAAGNLRRSSSDVDLGDHWPLAHIFGHDRQIEAEVEAQIGRASCREGVGRSVWISGGAVT